MRFSLALAIFPTLFSIEQLCAQDVPRGWHLLDETQDQLYANILGNGISYQLGNDQ